jgi:uncharacterized membrane protein YczE
VHAWGGAPPRWLGPYPAAMPLVMPIPADRRARRLVQLYAGLPLFGFSAALLVESTLGLDPWDVFHQGVARQTGLAIGTVTVAVSAAVLLLWIPLRQAPGLGTVSNAVLVGLSMNLSIDLLPRPEALVPRAGYLALGIFLNGVATGLYIGAGLGPGPRDGLMTGLARAGRSIRLVRTAIEVVVLALGWLLGGTVGVGTVAYALSIGPLAHVFIPMFTTGRRDAARRREEPARDER